MLGFATGTSESAVPVITKLCWVSCHSQGRLDHSDAGAICSADPTSRRPLAHPAPSSRSTTRDHRRQSLHHRDTRFTGNEEVSGKQSGELSDAEAPKGVGRLEVIPTDCTDVGRARRQYRQGRPPTRTFTTAGGPAMPNRSKLLAVGPVRHLDSHGGGRFHCLASWCDCDV